MFLDDLFNLVLVCKDIEPKYGRTRTREFFSTVRSVSFTTCMLFKNLLKHLFIKCSGLPFFKEIFFRQTNPVCNLFQLENIRKHLQPSLYTIPKVIGRR